MAEKKPREERKVVLVTCRLRHDTGWSDMTICNLSSRGMMAKCDDPPPRGAFVEVRRGPVVIVGQVRWSHSTHLGIHAQERIDIPTLLGKEAENGPAGADRRAGSRGAAEAKAKPSAADLAERSRRWGRLFDWAVLAVAGVAAAVLLVTQMHAILAAPLAQVRSALG